MRRGERGSVSVEMAVGYVPLMMLAALAVVACVRLASTAIDVNGAAAAAARQASIARNPAGAVASGVDAANAALTGRSVTCQPRRITVDTASMAPGGQVAVTVSCTVRTSDLTGLGLPGSITITRTSRQPVDTFRGVS
jgi:Flp pilus assembly protein TadG